MRLTDEQIELYSRQIILREVGGTGQSALRAACVRVTGAGAAAEMCTSYLVGAGVGTLIVDADDAGAPAARVLALPEAGRRTPDASVAHARHDDQTCSDVHLDLDLGGSVPNLAGPASNAPPARARLGSILLRAETTDAVRLVLLPADTGCPACVRVAVPPRGPTGLPPQTIALASAGAHAALVTCRWLLGIGDDRTARVHTLADPGGVWTDEAPPDRVACPRGCPPPAHPV